MSLIYILVGIALGFVILSVIKPIKKWYLKRKAKKPIIRVDDIKQLRSDINELRSVVNEIIEDMRQLHEVTNETQKNNELLFPENFDKDKEVGKTVFVKNGEEKPYETIDWRSR